MTYELIGIQRVKFTPDDGKEIKGVKLHIVFDGVEQANLEGQMCQCISLYGKDYKDLSLGEVELSYVPYIDKAGKSGMKVVGVRNVA